jgi:raffinose/stachyose/melibiose transport system substrate-binding protein
MNAWIGRAGGMLSLGRLVVAVIAGTVLALGVGASVARPARSDQVTLNMLAVNLQQPGWQVLISNFERVYPNVTVNATYLPNATLYQLESTELAAGNAPDLLSTGAGCGTPISICLLARSGWLAPMLKKPWVRWSIPLVTSADKYGQGLFAFTPYVTPWGMFTNNNLFRQLGLTVPQTLAQLLAVCQKAQAAGDVAVDLSGASTVAVADQLIELAVGTVYGPDKEWPGELRAGRVSFDGTPGWHQALQEFIDMNNAGCFQPGMTGTATQYPVFAQGQSLMALANSSGYGTVVAANPQFSFSYHPFPGGAAPGQTTTYLAASNSVSINAHSSPANQAAAQEFVDFAARPKQNALFTRLVGGVGQYQFLHGQVPAFMTAYAPVFKNHAYVINPAQTWWNANVFLALGQDGIGLVTGQSSIDDVLNAMDTAWKQGPA